MCFGSSFENSDPVMTNRKGNPNKEIADPINTLACIHDVSMYNKVYSEICFLRLAH